MFSSDHGEFTGSHRLHDKGPAMYEDIYRTAGIVRVPGAPAGQVRQEFVSLLDTTATVLDWCGLDPSSAVDSRSLLPLVRGDRKSTRLNSSHVAISYAVFCLKKKRT